MVLIPKSKLDVATVLLRLAQAVCLRLGTKNAGATGWLSVAQAVCLSLEAQMVGAKWWLIVVQALFL